MIGIISAASAFLVYFATRSDPSAIIYALAVSVVISVIVGRFRKFEPILPDMKREKIHLVLPWKKFGQLFRSYQSYEVSDSNTGSQKTTTVIKRLTRSDKILIVRAALSLLALRVGTSIAYPSIDYDIAGVPQVTGSGASIFDATILSRVYRVLLAQFLVAPH